ncbi:YppG family protein [Pseudobacillus badius]|uniref:YppG family protein n=1 Tax=Bacillus badius TaxID=1455 RepID=UPI0007B0879C|nr:YppG family protein [Bacillus badius]KZO00814.1 hypothetical protein A4244_02850 [Bacillus badius]OCS88222.1 hypothetical protein A6M11_02850 [Bacillus badius]OVE53249.1 hypothetical protein B1A98_00060 [Bacillus badius]TDW05584.1 YppG-like protein [Bacillus badius]GLY10859.1 hypothetical protein Bbad01_20750 [Bacillus badius]
MLFGPRQPRGPYPPVRGRRPARGQSYPQNASLLSYFRDQEGNYDIGKITATARQLNSIYGQVSPMIAKFINR